MNYENVNDINLAYNVYGNGRPCIMLHGNRDRKEVFDALARKLSEDCSLEIFAIDLRGHGDSEKPNSGYDMDHFIDDIYCFIKNKGLKDIVLVGHSLGSTIAIEFANRHSDLIEKLVLMSGAAEFKVNFERPEFTKDNFKEMIEETNKRAAKFFFIEGYENVKEEIVSNWSKIDFNVHMNLIRFKHPDLKETASNIEKDTLLIYGACDKLTPVENGKILNQLIKHSQLSTIPGTGHFMFMEKPDQVNEAIKCFLEGSKS